MADRAASVPVEPSGSGAVRLDRRGVLGALVLAGAGLVLPAGCGVPSGGGPVVDGPGPTYDPVSGQKGKPPDPSLADSPATLVDLFLAAISGPLETPELRVAARERARKFLTDSAAKAWQPDTDQVTVVRLEKVTISTSGRDVTTVVGYLQPVGILNTVRGEVQPYTDGSPAPVRAELTVVPGTGTSPLLIEKLPLDVLPPGLLLSSAALDEKYYIPQLIYFWDNSRRGLVPDLRYVPRTGLPASQQKGDVVTWLIGGPSELISSVAINIMPGGTQLLGPNVIAEGDKLVVNLTGALQGADLAKVMAQLRWSLSPLYPLDAGPVQLQIASRPQQVDGSGDAYLSANPADRGTRDLNAELFCVVGGQIEAVDPEYALPPVLAAPEPGRVVVQAAVSRDKHYAAFVTAEHRLRLGQAGRTDLVSFIDVGLTGAKWSRPAFLPSGRRVLVAIDGTLYAVSASGRVSTVTEGVTAFAVSPDGYRIALVGKGGGVAVGALRDNGDRLSVGGLRPLDAGRDNVTGVAWTRLDRVIVAGQAPEGYGLAEVSVDSAIRTTWSSTFKRPIALVVAYPKLPSQMAGSGPVMVQTDNGEAFRVFASSNPSPLTTRESTSRPVPTGPPVVKPPPTAPFYPD